LQFWTRTCQWQVQEYLWPWNTSREW
jgi:hypothetical protein